MTEKEMTDVVLVLEDLDDAQTEVVVISLRDLGMLIDTIDQENSIVEGTIPTERLSDVHKLAQVRYVRPVSTYISEFPDACPDDRED